MRAPALARRRRPVETEAPVVIEYSTAAVLFCFYYAKMLFTLASEEALTAQMVEAVTAAVESVDSDGGQLIRAQRIEQTILDYAPDMTVAVCTGTLYEGRKGLQLEAEVPKNPRLANECCYHSVLILFQYLVDTLPDMALLLLLAILRNMHTVYAKESGTSAANMTAVPRGAVQAGFDQMADLFAELRNQSGV